MSTREIEKTKSKKGITQETVAETGDEIQRQQEGLVEVRKQNRKYPGHPKKNKSLKQSNTFLFFS